MARSNDFICDKCGKSCRDAVVDGVSVPLVVYTVVGLAPGVEVEVDLNAVPLPEVLRDIAGQSVARREWCVACWAEEHGLPCVVPPPPAVEAQVVGP